MIIFKKDIRDKCRALYTIVNCYTGNIGMYQSTKKVPIEYLTRLQKNTKEQLGMEVDLVAGGNKMTIDITITL